MKKLVTILSLFISLISSGQLIRQTQIELLDTLPTQIIDANWKTYIDGMFDLSDYFNTSTQTTDDIAEGSTNLYDKTVILNDAGITVVSGTYPTFTITSTEVDGSVTNEIQDTTEIPGLLEFVEDHSINAYTETDPVFTASQANNITGTDITNLGNLSGTNTGDQDISNFVTINTTQTITGEKTFLQDILLYDTQPSIRFIDSDDDYYTQINGVSGELSFTSITGGVNPISFEINTDGVTPLSIYDKNDSKGTSGQVLSTTTTGIDWIDAASGGDVYLANNNAFTGNNTFAGTSSFGGGLLNDITTTGHFFGDENRWYDVGTRTTGISVSVDIAFNSEITLAANGVYISLSSLEDGMSGRVMVHQDATGGYNFDLVGFYSSGTLIGNVTQPDQSANSTSHIMWWSNDGTLYYEYIYPQPSTGSGGDMYKSAYDPSNINQQLVGLTASQSLTNKSVNGVTLDATGAATSYLDKTGNYSVPAGSSGTDLSFGGNASSIVLQSSTGDDVTFNAGTNITFNPVYTDAITINSSGGFSDPMTTRGDLIFRNSSNTTARLPIGAASYVLQSDGTDIGWVAQGAGHDAVTLNANATAAGLSLSTQELNYRAATNAQSGYMTSTLVGNIESNNSFRSTPSTVITAGTNLSWSGNTLNATSGGSSSGSVGSIQLSDGSGGFTSDANFFWYDSGNYLDITGDISLDGDFYPQAKIYDSNTEPGASGQILSSTGTGTEWINLNTVQTGITITMNVANGLKGVTTTLTANRTITLSNLIDGQEGSIETTQDAGGTNTVTLAHSGLTVVKMGTESEVDATGSSHSTIIYWRSGSILYYGFLHDN